MQWLINEIKNIYRLDILKLKSKFFLFIFNILPDLYSLRPIKNIFLIIAGIKMNGLQCYIKNKFHVDNPSTLTIHKNVFINRNVSFEGIGNIQIGAFSQIGPNVQFVTTQHLNREYDEIFDITIEENVWIGANCVILPGVYIARNINIAAGSIVKGKLCDGTLWAGNPAIKKK